MGVKKLLTALINYELFSRVKFSKFPNFTDISTNNAIWCHETNYDILKKIWCFLENDVSHIIALISDAFMQGFIQKHAKQYWVPFDLIRVRFTIYLISNIYHSVTVRVAKMWPAKFAKSCDEKNTRNRLKTS